MLLKQLHWIIWAPYGDQWPKNWPSPLHSQDRCETSRKISVSSRAEPEGLRARPSRAFYELFLCYTNEPTSRAFFEPSQEFHIVTSQIVNLRAKRSPSRARAELFGIFSYRCNEPSRAWLGLTPRCTFTSWFCRKSSIYDYGQFMPNFNSLIL